MCRGLEIFSCKTLTNKAERYRYNAQITGQINLGKFDYEIRTLPLYRPLEPIPYTVEKSDQFFDMFMLVQFVQSLFGCFYGHFSKYVFWLYLDTVLKSVMCYVPVGASADAAIPVQSKGHIAKKNTENESREISQLEVRVRGHFTV